MNSVKDENVITDSALKSAFEIALKVMHKYFNKSGISDLALDQCNRIIKSFYLREQRRKVNYKCIKYKDFNNSLIGNGYYFSVKDYIKKSLSNPIIFDRIVYEKLRPKNSNFIESISDLDQIKEEDSKLKEKELNCYINLYYDDFNISSRTSGNTDLSAILMNIANIDYKYTSKRSTADLIGMMKKAVKDKIGLDKFFEEIKLEIISLEKETIEVNGYQIYIKLFAVRGDNKAANEMIVDVSNNFTLDACKRCFIFYEELKTGDREFDDRQLTENHVLFGCKFYTRHLYEMDIFHDLTGATERIMGILLRNLSKSQIDNLNKQVKEIDRVFFSRLKMSGFKIMKSSDGIVFKGTGIQKLNFVILFSLIKFSIGNNSKEFEIYDQFKTILIYVHSHKFDKRELNDFDKLVKKFIKNYIDFFPNDTVTFKIHHTEHYKNEILEFGPLIGISTLPGERTLQRLKRSIEGSRNAINIPVSICKSFSLKEENYYILKTIRVFDDLDKINVQFKEYFKNFNDIQNIQQLSELISHNLKLKTKGLYLLEKSYQNLPIFVRIECMYNVHYKDNQGRNLSQFVNLVDYQMLNIIAFMTFMSIS